MLGRRLLVVLALLGACSCAGDAVRDEVLRVPSPDGVLDAVVAQTSSDATTAFGYVVTVPVHGCAAPDEPVLRVVDATRNVAASGVSVAWTGPRTVAVRYLGARFRDPEATPTVATAGGPVTVVAVEGVDDPTAPPGPMPALPAAARDC